MKNILVFGDSNSWGYDAAIYDPVTGIAKRFPKEKRWPGILQLMLGSEFNVIENCLNGRTLMQNDPYFPGRLGIESLRETLDANAPLDLVIIKLGCNELKHMFSLTAGMIAFGAEYLVQEVKQPYYGYPVPKVLLIAPHPTHPKIADMCFGFSYGVLAYQKSLELGALYREVAQRQGCAFFDCAPLAFELNSVDGLHYSENDHRKLAEAIEPIVREIF